MKILQVSNMLSATYGGSAEVPYQLSRELAARGHQVTIYTSTLGLNEERLASLPGVTVRAFRTGPALAGFCVTPGMAAEVKREVRDFDIIHLHNYRTFPNLVVSHYAKEYGVPYVLAAHGSLTTFFQKGGIKKALDAVWGLKMLRQAARVIAVTGMEAEQYRSLGVSRDRVEIIPHGINAAEFSHLPARGEFRKKAGLADDDRVILYLGRINRIKGLHLLSGAFADLATSMDRVRLVMAGPDDGYQRALRKVIHGLGIAPKVIFTGPLFGREKLEAYVAADVYVLPSSYEIFGITVLEALACGTPVIATDRCGLAPVVDGQAGLAVPYDRDRLRQALGYLLENEELRWEFGEKGKLLVRENFSWGKVAESIERVYNESRVRR
jgi:glycosyltransferase involved in cell wall biosynthesis